MMNSKKNKGTWFVWGMNTLLLLGMIFYSQKFVKVFMPVLTTVYNIYNTFIFIFLAIITVTLALFKDSLTVSVKDKLGATVVKPLNKVTLAFNLLMNVAIFYFADGLGFTYIKTITALSLLTSYVFIHELHKFLHAIYPDVYAEKVGNIDSEEALRNTLSRFGLETYDIKKELISEDEHTFAFNIFTVTFDKADYNTRVLISKWNKFVKNKLAPNTALAVVRK